MSNYYVETLSTNNYVVLVLRTWSCCLYCYRKRTHMFFSKLPLAILDISKLHLYFSFTRHFIPWLQFVIHKYTNSKTFIEDVCLLYKNLFCKFKYYKIVITLNNNIILNIIRVCTSKISLSLHLINFLEVESTRKETHYNVSRMLFGDHI
jgi:hypothetical protein